MVLELLIVSCLSVSGNAGDTAAALTPRRVITLDSARIVSPQYGKNLEGENTIFTVEPKCPVSRVVLYVGYYPWTKERLADLRQPPFSAEWDFGHVADQDQIYLQLGYTLYHVNGDTIMSGPTPHRWVIDRQTRFSGKRYVCRHAPLDREISIDGLADGWGRFPSALIDGRLSFRCMWTASDFFFFAEVSDSFLTDRDGVEIMFDLMRSRTEFAGINQRILFFSPRGRSFTWAVSMDRAEPGPVDSILIRMDEEKEWMSRRTERGYAIEARIPFCVLSELEFPPKRFGFDVAVVCSEDPDKRTTGVSSWSGAQASSRHNPSEWGTAVLRQPMQTLKLILASLIIIVSAMVVLLVLLIINQRRKDRYYEKKQRAGFSPLVRKALDIIDDHVGDAAFSINDLCSIMECEQEALSGALREETDAQFENLLEAARIRRARRLLRESEAAIENISGEVGYTDVGEFIRSFKNYSGVEPEKYRENRLEDPDSDQP